MKTLFCSSRREKAHSEAMFYARVHHEPGRPLTSSLSPAGGEGGVSPGEGVQGAGGPYH